MDWFDATRAITLPGRKKGAVAVCELPASGRHVHLSTAQARTFFSCGSKHTSCACLFHSSTLRHIEFPPPSNSADQIHLTAKQKISALIKSPPSHIPSTCVTVFHRHRLHSCTLPSPAVSDTSVYISHCNHDVKHVSHCCRCLPDHSKEMAALSNHVDLFCK